MHSILICAHFCITCCLDLIVTVIKQDMCNTSIFVFPQEVWIELGDPRRQSHFKNLNYMSTCTFHNFNTGSVKIEYLAYFVELTILGKLVGRVPIATNTDLPRV